MKRQVPKARNRRSRSSDIGSLDQRSLSSFAKLLLSAGVTPKHFGELATHAFVEAACDRSRFRNGKINKSRVAVLTALRRAEVTRLVSARGTMQPALTAHQPRTERVIAGWTSDRRYLDENGRPRRLRTSSRQRSFASLAKTFGGDVPHRALLDELLQMRAVREQGPYVELLIDRPPLSVAPRQSIQRVLPVLSDGVDVALKNGSANSCFSAQRLTLAASDLVELAMLRERTVSGVDSFLEGLRRSLQSQTRQRRRAKAMRRGITVSVLIREHDGNS
jgi:hypothetical protein